MKPEDVEKVRRGEELVADIARYVFDRGPGATVPAEIVAVLDILKTGTFPSEERMSDAVLVLDAAWNHEHTSVP